MFLDYTALVRISLRLKGCFYHKLFFTICSGFFVCLLLNRELENRDFPKAKPTVPVGPAFANAAGQPMHPVP